MIKLNKKIFHVSLVISIVSIWCLFNVDTASAWYVGFEKNQAAIGIKADISTPNSAPNLGTTPGAGYSNWVSTYERFLNGDESWIQSGWRVYENWPKPQHYGESCVHCHPGSMTYSVREGDYFDWGTTRTYYVRKISGTKWCGGYIYWQSGVESGTICDNTLHLSPVTVKVSSEMHFGKDISVDTVFTSIKYMGENDTSWKNVKLLTDFKSIVDLPYRVKNIADGGFTANGAPKKNILIPASPQHP